MPSNPQQDEELMRLCRSIPEETDPAKMLKLVQQLNQLLDGDPAHQSDDAPVISSDGGEPEPLPVPPPPKPARRSA